LFILIFHLEQDGEEKIPEPPSSDIAQGILPRLIATLVSRRCQVKVPMKDKSATPDKIIQFRVTFSFL
jgi:DNA polymerase alpha subunit A